MKCLRFVASGVLLFHVGCGGTANDAKVPEASKAEKPASLGTSVAPEIDPGFVGEELPLDLGTSIPAQVGFVGRHGKLQVVSLVLPADFYQAAASKLNLRSDENGGRYFYVDAPAAQVAFGLANDQDLAPNDQKQSPSLSRPNDSREPEHRIWLLLEDEAVSKLNVSVFFFVGHRAVTAKISVPSLPNAEVSGTKIWAGSLARRMMNYAHDDTFLHFARPRLAELAGGSSSVGPLSQGGRNDSEFESEMGRWMRLGSGYASVEAALHHRAALGSDVFGKPTVSLKTLTGPALRHHEWTLMLDQLGRNSKPNPLAQLTPASFYFVSAKGGDSLFSVLDEFDDWGTAALRLLEQNETRSNMLERYMTQLGLRRTGFSRLLGPQAMAEVAWIGSDPFLRRGSDVTLIFRPKNAVLLKAGLETVLAEVRESMVDVVEQDIQLSGENIKYVGTADKRLSRYEAEINGMLILSNSAAAISLVVDTAHAKSAPLADEGDFKYMLARDDGLEKGEPDVLAYLGDAFIERTVSPQARILDSRRGVAWSELRRLGNAALLGGYFGGPTNPTSDVLIAEKILKKEELRHFDGAQITMNGTLPPFSTWGTSAQMRPLIELPDPQLVSAQEAAAYAEFARSYEAEWGEVMDPIAVRLWLSKDKKQVSARVRVLPLARADEYGEILSVAGDERVEPGEGLPGVRFLLALGEDSFLRREANGYSSAFLGRPGFFDWVGEYAYVGLMDSPKIAEALRPKLAPRRDADESRVLDEFGALLEMPLYAAISIKSRATASIALAYVNERILSEESSVKHEKLQAYRDFPVWKVSYRDGSNLYSLVYSLGERTLFFALDETVVRDLLDREAQGLEPKSVKEAGPSSSRRGAAATANRLQVDSSKHTQFQAALRMIQGGGLATAIAWAADYEPLESASYQQAALVYGAWGNRSASVRDVFYHYWGEEPVTRDGRRYEWGASGVLDPARGGEFVLRWPRLPDPESQIGKLLSTIFSISASFGVETEAPGREAVQQSLSIGLDLIKR